MKKRKILIFGNYGGQNWGDEAILSGLLSVLSRSVFEIIVLSSSPKYTQRVHGVQSFLLPPFGFRSFFQFQFLKTIRAIRSSDILLFGGGGLFQDREKKAIWLWGWYRFFAGLFGKRILFVGNSVGPLRSQISQKIVKLSFEKSPFISVRDSSSKNLLKKIGVTSDRIITVTDAVFLLRKIPKVKYRKGTLLLLRGDGKLKKKDVAKLFSSLPKPIRAIAMDTIDTPFLESFGVPIILPKSVIELRKTISETKVVLSSRLHGGILALQAETPFILFSAAPKIQNFFFERGFTDVIFQEKFSVKKVKERILKVLKNSPSARKNRTRIRLEEQKKSQSILPVFLRI